jgi:hypothetical protein
MRGKGSIALLKGFEKGKERTGEKDFRSDNLEATGGGGTRHLCVFVEEEMRKAGFASKMEEKEEGVILLGLSPRGLFRKEYLVKISLLLLVEEAIAFLN